MENAVPLKDKQLIFMESQFIIFNLLTGKWDIGDIYLKERADGGADVIPEFSSRAQGEVPNNASVIQLNTNVNWAGRISAVVSGGQYGSKISSQAFGLSFTYNMVGGMKVVEGLVEQRFPDLP